MKVTILGCGTSTGVPLIHCRCPVCRSRNPKNHRLRSSVWVTVAGRSFLIDTSTDLRQQALRAGIPRIDAVLYTHPHADHIHGIDELRGFNFVQRETIPLYGNAWTCADLREKFKYIFVPKPVEGGGVPELALHELDGTEPSVEIRGVEVTPVALRHGSRECLGYRIGDFAYITDCSSIPEASLERLRGLSVLILDCLRRTPHPTHLNLEQALAVIADLKPRRTFLTHLGHDLDYTKFSKLGLPKGVALAYDGLRITLPEKAGASS